MHKNYKVPEAFKQMMTLAAAGATRKSITVAEETNWPELICYAQEQAVLPLVGCALIDDSGCCPAHLRSQLLEVVRTQSGTNMVRKQRVFRLIQELEACGYEVSLIKGYSIAPYYAFPECRGATDTDLLISSEQEKSMCAFLIEKGFSIEPRSLTSHHAIGQHPKLGMVEIHIQLYDDIVQDAWFQSVNYSRLLKEKPIRLSNEYGAYTALGITDNLVFLTLHMIKHFIGSGMGLRMMLDVALVFAKHKSDIDVERYWRLLNELHYAKLVTNVLWVMIGTGYFQPEDFPGLQLRDDYSVELIIYDLMYGGHMGTRETRASYDASEFGRQLLRQNRHPLLCHIYWVKHKIRSSYRQMIPGKQRLYTLYPVLRKKQWLLPLIQMRHMIIFPLKRIKEGTLCTSTISDETRRRIDMFKVLEMIK